MIWATEESLILSLQRLGWGGKFQPSNHVSLASSPHPDLSSPSIIISLTHKRHPLRSFPGLRSICVRNPGVTGVNFPLLCSPPPFLSLLLLCTSVFLPICDLRGDPCLFFLIVSLSRPPGLSLTFPSRSTTSPGSYLSRSILRRAGISSRSAPLHSL